ncbi:hypothetical protein DMC01_10110 [Campylobacter troglodytis]|nr:hypothetical protein DMC01_10110 [Campylobacter troglodytis]
MQSLKKVKFTATASKLMMAWLIFCVALPTTLQEEAKAQGFAKHSAQKFAKGRNYINEIVNF